MSDEEKEITAEAEETAETEDTETAEGEEAVEAAPKAKKQKKVVRRRKTKKERENLLTVAIRLAVESGKVEFGARTGIAASILGKAKVFVLAANTPAEYRTKLQGYAKTAKIPIIDFEGSTMELGSVCGKPFPISILSVFEEGSSNILEFVKK
ncbi:MAG: 50S ribosomal protein L30e [Candidatus ainarchaeum sp.]|nr:50S ribosomal protein L30e [Candidatus ainarchaeum sp.]